MPYKTIEEANPALRGIEPPITLEQANMIAAWADKIEAKGQDANPWAVAISLFKKTHHVEEDKWVKNEGSEAEFSAFLRGQEEPDQPYIVDLLSALPSDKSGKPDFSQPFRILPVGDIHRMGRRQVTPQTIEEFAQNWLNREKRGIRRKRVVIDAEHQTGGIGWYTAIFSRGQDGLWATIALSNAGEKLLAERDFSFFSPAVAWQIEDAVTGEIVRNQIVGGALTNYPVLGDATRLPVMGYSWRYTAPAGRDDQDKYAATKAEGDGDYPAEAYLVVEDPEKPTTWHLRVKERVNGKLEYTANMCGKAAAALGPKGFRGQQVQLSEEDRAAAKKKLLAIYRNELKVEDDQIPKQLFSEKGDDDMTVEFSEQERGLLRQLVTGLGNLLKGQEKKPDVELPEEFTAMQGLVEQLKAKVETLGTEKTALQQQVAAETYARQLQEMRGFVQMFSHLPLPVELPKDAPAGSMTTQEHLLWLRDSDSTEGKKHWAFFAALLATLENTLKEVALYGELGASSGAPASPDAALDLLAQKYATDHKVPYLEALKAVAATSPRQAA